MDEKVFWRIIEESKLHSSSNQQQEERMIVELSKLAAEDVREFAVIFQTKMLELYRNDLWAIAYIINHGCSNDGFTEFRAWLICQGREFYGQTINRPEFVGEQVPAEASTIDADDSLSTCHSFDLIASSVYEEKTGYDMYMDWSKHRNEPKGEAQGKDRVEAQMILNHKDAIEFLVDNADEIGFNRFSIRNLHGLLANNLLPDPQSAGRLRSIEVAIAQSAFQPLSGPQLIEECFDQILNTAAAIKDPFEQSFFALVHLPYLQAFDDVNKRVSRLASNIPMIRANLVPLTFSDVPRSLYTQAVLGVYELNRIELLRDVYLWAYKKSAERYVAARQSLGEPDPFRLEHRDALRQVVGAIVKDQLNRAAAFKYLEAWTAKNVAEEDRDEFQRVAEDEILALHEGNFARYQVRPSAYEAWRKVWDRKFYDSSGMDSQLSGSARTAAFPVRRRDTIANMNTCLTISTSNILDLAIRAEPLLRVRSDRKKFLNSPPALTAKPLKSAASIFLRRLSYL